MSFKFEIISQLQLASDRQVPNGKGPPTSGPRAYGRRWVELLNHVGFPFPVPWFDYLLGSSFDLKQPGDQSREKMTQNSGQDSEGDETNPVQGLKDELRLARGRGISSTAITRTLFINEEHPEKFSFQDHPNLS